MVVDLQRVDLRVRPAVVLFSPFIFAGEQRLGFDDFFVFVVGEMVGAASLLRLVADVVAHGLAEELFVEKWTVALESIFQSLITGGHPIAFLRLIFKLVHIVQVCLLIRLLLQMFITLREVYLFLCYCRLPVISLWYHNKLSRLLWPLLFDILVKVLVN